MQPPRRAARTRILLGLLLVLGMLGMHGTPSMSTTGATMTMAMLQMDLPAMEPLTAGPAGTASPARPPGGGGTPAPGGHHLMASCLSTLAPGGVLSPIPTLASGTTGAPPAGRVVAQVGSERAHPATPPDLDRLCISRT